MSPTIDLSFRIMGDSVPYDHAYALYSALATFNAGWHQAEWLGIHPINGLAFKDAVRLTRFSHLRLRTPPEKLPELIRLAGKRLLLKTNSRRDQILIGVPQVLSLRPSPSLRASCMTIKISEVENTERTPDREMFLSAAQKQLAARNIVGDLWINHSLDTQGREHSRRVLRIKHKIIIGYAVTVSNLSDEDSLRLQVEGLGGRRKFGCGLFLPVRSEYVNEEQQ
jgi:CRISPR-associated protein Cas6